MTTVYDRLGLTLDTSLFGDAANLSSAAANSLAFIADNTPPMPQWQINDLTNGSSTPIVRTTYFQNPMANTLANIHSSAVSIYNTSQIVMDASMSYVANLIVANSNSFTGHTNNIAGVSTVTDANVPSYDTASALGQQVMMILAKTDGNTSVKNTAPILGSFSSLFVANTIQANANVIYFYAGEYANSIVSDGMGGYVSTLSPSEISNIQTYLVSTSSFMYTRESFDKAYYVNAKKVVQDFSFLQQFNTMGGTNTYLTTNIIGTKELANNLTSNS